MNSRIDVAHAVIPSDKAVVTQKPSSLTPSSLARRRMNSLHCVLNADSVWHYGSIFTLKKIYYTEMFVARYKTLVLVSWGFLALNFMSCIEQRWSVTESWNPPGTHSSCQLMVQSKDKPARILLTGNLGDDTWWTNSTVQRQQCLKKIF